MKINFFNKKIFSTKLLVLAIIFVAIMATVLIDNLIQIKKGQLQNSLSQEAATVENILLQRFNSTFFIIEKMGKEISQKPHDKPYIKTVLEKYKSDASLSQIFSWTIFSWSNQNGQIIVDGEYGIMEIPFDLSQRDYVQEAASRPAGQMLFGKPVYGSTSKKWMIPGGVSLEDSNQKRLGMITIGFEIENLAKIIQEALKNENVNVKLFYDNQFPVFDVNKSFIKIFSSKEIGANSHNNKNENFDKQLTLNRNLENYPYHLILTYEKHAVSLILWEIIYSRIIEILTVILLSFGLLVIIYRSEEEKRKKIASLSQKEALSRAKNEFMLRVGHELKNFVSAIIGLSDIVKEDLKNKNSLNEEDNKEEIGHLEHINDISQELMSYVTDLIDLNQSEDGKFEVKRLSQKTNFEDMVDRSIRILQSKIKNKNIIVNTSVDQDLLQIDNLDQRRIKQVLVSVIGNAIKYSAESSKINIAIKNLDRTKIEITVKDCGIGMSEAAIKLALANYHSEKHGINNESDSIELKLPIVRFLVEKQNGNISITSIRDYGTEVKIVF